MNKIHFPYPATSLWSTRRAPHLSHGVAISTDAVFVRGSEKPSRGTGIPAAGRLWITVPGVESQSLVQHCITPNQSPSSLSPQFLSLEGGAEPPLLTHKTMTGIRCGEAAAAAAAAPIGNAFQLPSFCLSSATIRVSSHNNYQPKISSSSLCEEDPFVGCSG